MVARKSTTPQSTQMENFNLLMPSLPGDKQMMQEILGSGWITKEELDKRSTDSIKYVFTSSFAVKRLNIAIELTIFEYLNHLLKVQLSKSVSSKAAKLRVFDTLFKIERYIGRLEALLPDFSAEETNRFAKLSKEYDKLKLKARRKLNL